MTDSISRPIMPMGLEYDQDKVIDIKCARSDDFQNLDIKVEGRTVVSISANEQNEINVELREQPGTHFTGDIVSTQQADVSKIESAWLESAGTNWRIEDQQVVFSNSRRKEMPILLPKHEPGLYTPQGINPVYGQPDMMFCITLGIWKQAHTLMSGPTGTGKTTAYQFIAQMLGYNFFRIQIDPRTEGASLVGEYLPAGTGKFEWTDGILTEAVRASREHPTIVIFDELSRIGNVAELARIYSLLDDSRRLTIPERRHEMGQTEVIEAGDLYIGATMNPADDPNADYIGVRELDPALLSRFSYMPEILYPSEDVERRTLRERVYGLSDQHAERMVKCANRVRVGADIHYPFSFRELLAWGEAIPYYGYMDAHDIAVVRKASVRYHKDLRNNVTLD